MKVVQINTTCGVGSTGKICVNISQMLTHHSIENYILYSVRSNGYDYGIKCSGDKYQKIQALKSRLFGNYGFNSCFATKRMINNLDMIKPDIVHFHNIHGHDCNLRILLDYLKKHRIKVIWTFHDCWVFTGYCTHFVMAKCDKWKNQCYECVKVNDYSWFFDRSKKNYLSKKKALEGLDLTIITPSKWMANLVKQSFLKDNPIEVIHNGINLNVFSPSNSEFRAKHNLEDKYIVLGVSFDWSIGKGLDVLVELSHRLRSDYVILLVGTNDKVDELLPDNIVSIHRTQNQKELVEIYSAADVFVNPTREDNFPTVNMEAIACGTPVVTFKTGGSPEIVDETCGSVVECDDIDALEKEIIRICTEKTYSRESCINKAKQFDKNERYKEYLELYERVVASGIERN